MLLKNPMFVDSLVTVDEVEDKHSGGYTIAELIAPTPLGYRITDCSGSYTSSADSLKGLKQQSGSTKKCKKAI